MLLVADVHGAAEALGKVAGRGETILVLGDLVNFIDYRSLDGILADVYGKQFVAEVVALRAADDHQAARHRWRQESAGREAELQATMLRLVTQQYREVCGALAGSRALVTYGNVDWPDLLIHFLPEGARFVDGEVIDLEGYRVGFAGGGVTPPGVTAGRITEEEMAAKLARLGPVDILCTHAAPDVPELCWDVVAGRMRTGFRAIVEYVLDTRPRWHYFGDVHQPRATQWQVGETLSRNVGYFRATGRAVRHD